MAIFWGRTVHTLSLVSTFLQWPLSSVPKVVSVERFNCSLYSLLKVESHELRMLGKSMSILLFPLSFELYLVKKGSVRLSDSGKEQNSGEDMKVKGTQKVGLNSAAPSISEPGTGLGSIGNTRLLLPTKMLLVP